MRRTLAKLARMDAHEIGWRGTVAARTAFDRARLQATGSGWSRKDLLARLAISDELSPARDALSAHEWLAAHAALSNHFARAPRRLSINPQSRDAIIERILREFPGSAHDAALRGDRIVSGTYDLLGYRSLRFDRSAVSGPADMPDWSLDPVHNCRPPQRFWSSVPYLDASCGDHKIIWELNRHQHWLSLGRAFWLTGDRRYRDRCLAELASWLRANPPLTGINWASMLEVAFRSMSWLWAIQMFVEPSGDSEPWLVDLLVGLDRQLAHVERNLSHYFSPNTHLLGEALALYVTGRALPELAASRRRASIGRGILIREIARQIAADGGHCERSTHYHRYALDFYELALIVARQSGDIAAEPQFKDAVTRMAVAARLLADDRGRVPHIGDDDGGALMPIVGRDPDDLRASLAVAAALLDRPGLQIDATPEDAVWMLGPDVIVRALESTGTPVASAALTDTGYYVSRSAGHHLLIDAGPHGYQNGGHAHADALSMTLAVRGIPLLIDPGTGCYTTDPAMRDRLRSTAFHNTVEVDRRSQSLPDGPFHWSHVANGQTHRWCTTEAFDYFDGSHDGYVPLEHRRRVLALHADLVVVADFVDGSGTHTAAIHWHIDPRWSVEMHARGATLSHDENGGDSVALSVPEGRVDAFSGDDRTGLGWSSPAYGRVDRTTTLRVAREGEAPFWLATVFGLDRDNAVVRVDWIPVWAEVEAVAHATAMRIERTRSIDYVIFGEPSEGVASTRADVNLRITRPSARESTRPLWRAGDVETDARMLFYRSTWQRPIACIGVVDGSVVRDGRRGFEWRTDRPCVASPVS
jgi:Heparinase II/III-like protein/Heparinase II/III N-terminus